MAYLMKPFLVQLRTMNVLVENIKKLNIVEKNVNVAVLILLSPLFAVNVWGTLI